MITIVSTLTIIAGLFMVDRVQRPKNDEYYRDAKGRFLRIDKWIEDKNITNRFNS